jgi:hypothetical protein
MGGRSCARPEREILPYFKACYSIDTQRPPRRGDRGGCRWRVAGRRRLTGAEVPLCTDRDHSLRKRPGAACPYEANALVGPGSHTLRPQCDGCQEDHPRSQRSLCSCSRCGVGRVGSAIRCDLGHHPVLSGQSLRSPPLRCGSVRPGVRSVNPGREPHGGPGTPPGARRNGWPGCPGRPGRDRAPPARAGPRGRGRRTP